MRFAPHRSFEVKELFFYVKSAAVAAQFAVTGDDAMAWNYYWNRIVVIGHAHGAKSIRAADFTGDVGVGAGFAVRDFEQGIPAAELEGGSLQVERNGEFAARAGEIFVEFTTGVTQNFVFVLGPVGLDASGLQAGMVVVERGFGESALGRDEQRVSDRRLVRGEVHEEIVASGEKD
jgi:hypothetical protein